MRAEARDELDYITTHKLKNRRLCNRKSYPNLLDFTFQTETRSKNKSCCFLFGVHCVAWSRSVVLLLHSVSKQRHNSIITDYHTPLPRSVSTRQDLEPLLRLCLQSVKRVGFQNFFCPNRKRVRWQARVKLETMRTYPTLTIIIKPGYTRTLYLSDTENKCSL